MARIVKRWTPKNWVSWSPFGIGNQRPNNYKELWKALAENRDELGFAWRILTQGVCDGCALGTTGIHDWTLDGVHLCNIRLRLLRLNTMPALDSQRLENVESLRSLSSEELRNLGRLPHPMVRRKGEQGFQRLSWDEALDLIADRIRAVSPDRTGYYLTSRGMPNESYYCAQKAVRGMGSNNVDNAARICHSPSTNALKATLGVAATTCSYTDWIASDLIVFIGSNVANNQPVSTKYIHYAKKNGARVLVVNPYREPGMERYWIPSIPESAVFGTKIADRFFEVNVGGDIAFLNGVIKTLLNREAWSKDFVRDHTVGFDALRSSLDAQRWEDLEGATGTSRSEMEAFADEIGRANRAVFVWSMGITQHECGVDNVQAILNLALLKGYVGREGCGVMPIRGHSGVQGGAEMGAYATVFPGGVAISPESAAKFSELWGFDVPAARGKAAPEMIDAASSGELDVLFSAGGSFTEVLPEPDWVEQALERVPLRVHMDILLTRQMLLDPSDTVVLLPAATRYEIPGGVTQTSTERRIIFSPEVPGRRIVEARSEWEVFLDLARRVRPDRADLLHFESTADVRQEIARAVPFYAGIESLSKQGDQFQYGGPHLCEGWQFLTPDGKAHFTPVALRWEPLGEGQFRLTTRRGKQFNSMVHERMDMITGHERQVVLMNAQDASRMGLPEGTLVRLRNDIGEMEAAVAFAPVKSGNLQVHWPEGNVLIDRRKRSPEVGVPDYNALVSVARI